MTISAQAAPTQTDSRSHRFKRAVASLIVAALATGGLAAITATPANAAVTDSVTGVTGSWNVSDRWLNYVMYPPAGYPFTLSPASSVTPSLPTSCTLEPSITAFDANQDATCVVPLTGTAGGNVDLATGAITGIDLGSITWVSPHFPGGVALENLELNADPATHIATVTADVSGDAAAVPVATEDVVIATFDLSAVTPSISDGVVTYTDLVGTVSPTINTVIPSWTSPNYAGAATSPLSFSVSTATPTVEATITSSTPGAGVVVSVTGDGFRGVTNTGDAGIYVAIAPAGGLPSLTDASAYITASWIRAASLADGTFATTLTVAADKFDLTKTYSVYTWQAHTHSNATQDTETELSIDPESLEWKTAIPELTVSNTSIGFGSSVTATVTVPTAATGSVEFYDGSTSLGTATVSNGEASKTISGLKVGSHNLTASYSGDNSYVPSNSAVVSLTVAKGTTTTGVAVSSAKQVYGKALTITATVPSAATGKVQFFDGSTSLGTVSVSKGKAAKSVKLKAGAHKITAKYLGDGTYQASTSTVRTATITKATSKKVTVSGKKFAKKSKPKVTVKVTRLNNGSYATGVVTVVVKGKVVGKATLKASNKGVVTLKLKKKYSTAITVRAHFVPKDSANVASKQSKTVKIKTKK